MSDEELDHLKAENEALAARVNALEDKPAKQHKMRRVVALIAVILTVLTFATAVPGTWMRRTFINTDRYVATVGPLAQDPAIQEYLARTVTDQVFTALDVQGRLSTVLGDRDPRLAFLAGPITNAVHGFVEDQVRKIFASETFANYWVKANEFVHDQLVAALKGDDDGTLSIQNGRVVLNLLPLVNQGLKAVSGVASDLIGRPITLPEVTGTEVPSEVVSKLESTLGVSLPDQFGTITVYNSNELASVQRAVDMAGRFLIGVVFLFVLFFAIALWVSPRRRRTLIQLMAAMAVMLVIERRFAIASANKVVDEAKPENQAAAKAVVDQVLSSLLRYTGWMLAIVLIVLVIALVTGPYPWAVRLRTWIRGVGSALAGAASGAEESKAGAWVAAHRDAMMLVGAGVAILIMLVIDLSLASFLLVAILLGIYEVIVYRASQGATAPNPPSS